VRVVLTVVGQESKRLRSLAIPGSVVSRVDYSSHFERGMMACSSSTVSNAIVDALNALTHDRLTACSVPDAMIPSKDCNDPATLIGLSSLVCRM